MKKNSFYQYYLKIIRKILTNKKIGGGKISVAKENNFFLANYYKVKTLNLTVRGCRNNIQIEENFISNEFDLYVCGENNEVKIGSNFINEGLCKICVIGNNNKIIIGNDIKIVQELCVYNHDDSYCCNITIGNKTTFNKTQLHNYDNNSSIYIGEDCMFAYDTVVYNTDGHAIFQNGKVINYAKNLFIGNHVWCGWGSTILKNSYIPDNCVIGKSAIVSKKFDKENVAIAGNPAKIIKYNIVWDRKSVNKIKNK